MFKTKPKNATNEMFGWIKWNLKLLWEI
jgi:hypothetical protein